MSRVVASGRPVTETEYRDTTGPPSVVNTPLVTISTTGRRTYVAHNETVNARRTMWNEEAANSRLADVRVITLRIDDREESSGGGGITVYSLV